MFVHADDIKTHETFFNFTNHFFLFKQDKLVSVLTCSMYMDYRPIEKKIIPNTQKKLSVFAIKK